MPTEAKAVALTGAWHRGICFRERILRDIAAPLTGQPIGPIIYGKDHLHHNHQRKEPTTNGVSVQLLLPAHLLLRVHDGRAPAEESVRKEALPWEHWAHWRS